MVAYGVARNVAALKLTTNEKRPGIPVGDCGAGSSTPCVDERQRRRNCKSIHGPPCISVLHPLPPSVPADGSREQKSSGRTGETLGTSLTAAERRRPIKPVPGAINSILHLDFDPLTLDKAPTPAPVWPAPGDPMQPVATIYRINRKFT